MLTINISSGYGFYLYSVVISLPRFKIEKLPKLSITGTCVCVCGCVCELQVNSGICAQSDMVLNFTISSYLRR